MLFIRETVKNKSPASMTPDPVTIGGAPGARGRDNGPCEGQTFAAFSQQRRAMCRLPRAGRRITTSIGLPQTRQSAFSALAAPRAVTFVLLAPLSFAIFSAPSHRCGGDIDGCKACRQSSGRLSYYRQ